MDFGGRSYVAWLSKKTGQPYRLVSESLREYAARAGSTGPFPFPFDEGKEYSIAKHANTYGAADGYNFTAPAGSFPANAFGVYDMHGNIYEWTADCYNDNYVGAPSDGSAWFSGKCEVRRIRGNDWGEARCFRARATATPPTPTPVATGSASGSPAICNAIARLN
jgi:formylglycine-generating enzyme required for sulfatase activity